MFANDLKRNFVIGLFAYANCVSKLTLSGAVIWNVKEDLRQVSLALAKQEGYHPWGNGTRAAAENAKRKLEAQLPSLEQHETWLKTQRQTVVRK